MSEFDDWNDEKDHNFFDDFRKLGGSMSYERDSFEAEKVEPFMINKTSEIDSGPYVFAADYFLLLKRYREVIRPTLAPIE